MSIPRGIHADPSRAQGGLAGQLGENSDRMEAWLAGVEAFLSSPIFGVGSGRLVDEASTEIGAHNWYINVLGETGIMGFILCTNKMHRVVRSTSVTMAVRLAAASSTGERNTA